jgi:hypothetical protein
MAKRLRTIYCAFGMFAMGIAAGLDAPADGAGGGLGVETEADRGWLSASRIAAISCCWSTTISCAIRRSCSLRP